MKLQENNNSQLLLQQKKQLKSSFFLNPGINPAIKNEHEQQVKLCRHLCGEGKGELAPAVSVLRHVEKLGLHTAPVQLVQLVVALDHAGNTKGGSCGVPLLQREKLCVKRGRLGA